MLLRGHLEGAARDHALAFGAERDRRLPGQDAGASLERGCADLFPERRDRRDEIERAAGAAAGAAAGTATATSGAPQSPQNFSVPLIPAPHEGQA
jgi:hypothetical protein